MSANIFAEQHRLAITGRISRLTADATRQWGTMSTAQMLRHCRAQIDFVLNPAPQVKVYKTMLRFKPVRWMALYGPQWPKNSPTAPEMDVNKKLTDTRAFDNEKTLLLNAVDVLNETETVSAIHPLFGMMGKKDWGRVVWKHLDHHLRQFGG